MYCRSHSIYIQVITQPWPSCFRNIHAKHRNYAGNFSRDYGYCTGDSAVKYGDGTFQVLGRKDNRVIMSLPHKQTFYTTHSEVLNEICEQYCKRVNVEGVTVDFCSVVSYYTGLCRFTNHNCTMTIIL